MHPVSKAGVGGSVSLVTGAASLIHHGISVETKQNGRQKVWREMSNTRTFNLSPCLQALPRDAGSSCMHENIPQLCEHTSTTDLDSTMAGVIGRLSKFREQQDMQNWNSLTIFVVIEFHSVLAIKNEQQKWVLVAVSDWIPWIRSTCPPFKSPVSPTVHRSLKNTYSLILRRRNPFIANRLSLSSHVTVEKQQPFHVLYLWHRALSWHHFNRCHSEHWCEGAIFPESVQKRFPK